MGKKRDRPPQGYHGAVRAFRLIAGTDDPYRNVAFEPPFHPHETHMETRIFDRGAYRYVLQVSIRTPIEDSGFDVRFMRVKWGSDTMDCDRYP